MRLFIAIDLPEWVKRELVVSTEEIMKNASNHKLMANHKMHITLAFIGDVELEKVKKIENIIDSCFNKKVPISIKGFMHFEKKSGLIISRQPSVPASLTEQVLNLKKELTKLGVEFDHKDFVPHITISRNTIFDDGFDYRSLNTEDIDFTADTVTLFDSVLEGDDYIYIKLYEKELVN